MSLGSGNPGWKVIQDPAKEKPIVKVWGFLVKYKKPIRYILSPIGLLILFYLCCAFIFVEPDFRKWDIFVRALFIFIWIVGTCFTFFPD